MYLGGGLGGFWSWLFENITGYLHARGFLGGHYCLSRELARAMREASARIAALALCVARVRRRRAAWPGMWPRVAAARAATSSGCSGARCGRVCVCCAKLELWQMCRAEWCAMAAGGVSLARAECARRCRVRTRVRERRTVARVASRCRVRRVTREEA